MNPTSTPIANLDIVLRDAFDDLGHPLPAPHRRGHTSVGGHPGLCERPRAALFCGDEG
jgi:hypothetical protein